MQKFHPFQLKLQSVLAALLFCMPATVSGAASAAVSEGVTLLKQNIALQQNIFEVQTMLANYGVDWPSFPQNVAELNTKALAGSYWKALKNPFTAKTGLGDVLLDFSRFQPGKDCAGKVFYEPLPEGKLPARHYRLYACNAWGYLALSSTGLLNKTDENLNQSYTTKLHDSAQKGNLNSLRSELRTHALDEPDRFGLTPLMWAAHAGQTETVKFLRSQGARFNSAASINNSQVQIQPMILAIESKDEKWPLELLAQHAEFNQRNEDGETPLSLAVESGMSNLVDALLARQASGADRALMWAAQQGNLKLAGRLLPAGAPGLQDALSSAASYGQLKMLEWLLQHGADARQPDNWGENALTSAVNNGQSEIITWLLSHGLSPDQRNAEAQTPLMLACRNNNLALVKSLLAKGADKMLLTAQGSNLLHIAIVNGHAQMLDFLLTRGLDPNLQNRDGISPLMLAVIENHPDMVKTLLAKGADQRLKNHQGQTALDLASYYGYDASIRLLKGKDPN